MRKTNTKKFEPAEWQRDPETLKDEKVQYWRHGVLATLLPLDEAKRLVREGRCFAIGGFAIEDFDKDDVR
mgnify:CR=1 FL=1